MTNSSKTVLFLISLFLIFSWDLLGQDSISLKKKVLTINKVTEPINLDGLLNETFWLETDIANDFIQLEPSTGELSVSQTEVRMGYDDKAIYVGVKMYDDNPTEIKKELSIRDEIRNADNFIVIFDPYKSGQNGFAFGVTASKVQLDFVVVQGAEDNSWNAVWESAVNVSDEGWTVEMKIPYSALRFPDTNIQEWYINFTREIRRYREKSFWNPINREIEGFLNQSGILKGLENIKSPPRLSITPFVASYLNTSYDPKNGQWDTGTAYNAGMDVKYGLSDAFTLDMTLIPDFGQTITDKQVLNLSPFEVFFEENRQFFTEGLDLFGNRNLFYTRRVGGNPFYSISDWDLKLGESIVENPERVQLYNATKISGRNTAGTGFGFFNAIEKETHATIRDSLNSERRIQTNPLTNYNVIVVDQNLKNNSSIRFTNANVIRRGEARDANNSGLFFNLFSNGQKYNLSGNVKLSQKFENEGTDLGYAYNLRFQKDSGKWRYGTGHWFESYDFDPNDTGLLFAPNEKGVYLWGGMVDFKPKNEKLQLHRHFVNVEYGRLHKPDVFTFITFNTESFYLYKSRFAFGLDIGVTPIESRDYFEPRTEDYSVYLPEPARVRFGGFISTDYRKPLAADLNMRYTKFDFSGRYNLSFFAAPRIRFNDRFSISCFMEWDKRLLDQGYITESGGDIVIGTRDRQVIENSISGNYIFTNNMALKLFLRHYWDEVEYSHSHILQKEGVMVSNTLDNLKDFDRNFNFFSIDLEYSWRFAPGSDLIILWKNNVLHSNQELGNNYFRNLSDIFDNRQYNDLSLKIIYFLDYAELF